MSLFVNPDNSAFQDAIASKIYVDKTGLIELTNSFLGTLDYYFKPVRELPTGRDFADFVYIPKPAYREDYPALVVELKWNKAAETALQQIKGKRDG